MRLAMVWVAGLLSGACGGEGLTQVEQDTKAILGLSIPLVVGNAGGQAGGQLLIFDSSGYGFESLEREPYRDEILAQVDAGLLHAFVLANQQEVRIDPRLLALETGYALVDRDQTFEGCRACDPLATCDCWAILCAQYPELAGMLTLSSPGFQGDLALVHVYYVFGSRAYRREIVLLQKQQAGWAILEDLLLE